jgi:hypothetical protein
MDNPQEPDREARPVVGAWLSASLYRRAWRAQDQITRTPFLADCSSVHRSAERSSLTVRGLGCVRGGPQGGPQTGGRPLAL